MQQLTAVVWKELLLLWRDRAGLLVLFVMPAILVLVITLVQENVLKVMGESKTKVLFVDLDRSFLGKAIAKNLLDLGTVELVSEIKGKSLNQESMRQAIREGDFQFGVVIPAASSQLLKKQVRNLAEQALSSKRSESKGGESALELVVSFDPAVRGGFRSAVVNSLNRAVLAVEIEEKMRVFAELLPARISQALQEVLGPYLSVSAVQKMPTVDLEWVKVRQIDVREELAFRSGYAKIPTSVQQNVPAWALFGMFFIVLPMAGSLIRERQEGALARLLTMPVSRFTLLAGKVAAYLLVCLGQFALVLVIGKTLLPLLGTPELDMGTEPLAILAVVVSATLAATGFGLLLGSVSRTFEQASMFGSISVVIAAALGGIMVPVYAMPKLMQAVSVISPLGWGLEAIHDVFVRGGGFSDILPEILALLVFFGCSLLGAWLFLFQKVRSGR